MKPSDETFIMPGKDAPETWRADGRDGATLLEGSKGKSAGWIALPMRSVISVPMRFSGMAPERRQSAAALELEGLGIHAADTDYQVEVRDADQREQRVWTVVQTSTLPKHVSSAPIDAKFAPSVCFRSLKRGEAQIWSESGHLALAIPDEAGKPLYAQSLSSSVVDEDAAAELRCILAGLELAGISPEVNEVVIQQHADHVEPAENFAPFATAVGLPVATELEKKPHLPKDAWHILPPSIVQRRNDRRQQQTMMLASAGLVLVLVAMLAAFGGRLWTRDRALNLETVRLNALQPELDAIEEAKGRSILLDPAINREKFAMELYHQVARLLPDKDIRLEDFTMRDGQIIVQGTASNPALANQLSEDLQREKAFAGLVWEVPPPTTNADGTAHFRFTGAPPTDENAPSL